MGLWLYYFKNKFISTKEEEEKNITENYKFLQFLNNGGKLK